MRLRGLSGSLLEHPHSGGDEIWGFIGAYLTCTYFKVGRGFFAMILVAN